jgi:hypothetical protein
MGSERGPPHSPGGTYGHLRVKWYGTYSCDRYRAVNGRACWIRFIGYSSIAAMQQNGLRLAS